MTDYATSTDLDTHYGAEQVLIAADRDGTGISDTGVIAAAITKASEEIDSYLGVRYTLPLTAVPGILVSVCCEIAMYRLSINHPSMTDEKRQRYEDALKWLRDVAKGLASLGSVGATLEASVDLPEVSSDNEDRLFSRTKLAGLV